MDKANDDSKTIRLAAVQAAPEFLDREASLEKACSLIAEASQNGAKLVGFPEGFIPTHPLWYHFHPDSSLEALTFAKRLFLNAVEIPSSTTDVLCRAAKEFGIYVVMGMCERVPGRIGAMYNSLLFINSNGKILGRHRKLVPTLGERLVHMPGDAMGLRTYDTPFGRIGGLMCGENSNSLADFVLNAQGINIHIASWPAHFSLRSDMREVIMTVSRGLAYRLKAFVINAVGEVSERMCEEMAASDQHREYLKRQGGGASIIGPRGQIIAGPMPVGEGILYADVKLEDLVIPKLTHDFSGHYNRFDIFDVRVSRGVWPNLSFVHQAGENSLYREAFSIVNNTPTSEEETTDRTFEV